MERLKPIQGNLLSSHDGVDISLLPQCRDSLQMYIKEGRFGVLRRLQQLRSYHNEIETRNRGKIPFSLQTVQRGLSVAEEPQRHIFI